MRIAALGFALLPALAAPCLGGNKGPFTDFSNHSIGTAGSDFLLMDIGARGIAMGGAYSAVTNDAYSLYWNPAGLTKIPRFSAGFMYTRYVEDITYQSASLAYRLTDSGVLAGGWRYRDIGTIDHTNLAGDHLGSFHPRDYIAEAGWGQSIFDLSDSDVDINMGVAARWIHSDILLHADGYSGDIGLQSRFYSGRYAYDFAFVAQNMGIGQKFDKTRDTLPFRAKLGGAIHPTRSLILSFEGLLPINNIPHGALGLEYTFEATKNVKTSLRGGFNSLTLQNLGVPTTVSGGLGINVGDLGFDYAFVPLGVLGDQIHRFSISYNLPPKASRRYRER